MTGVVSPGGGACRADYLAAALAFFLAGFLTSRFGAFLFAMFAVYAIIRLPVTKIAKTKDDQGKSASTR
jgi:hypothetical protein